MTLLNYCFQVMASILIGIGLIFAVIFHIGTKERIDDNPVRRKLSVVIVDFMVRY